VVDILLILQRLPSSGLATIISVLGQEELYPISLVTQFPFSLSIDL
jgi:hypothetical protein